MSNQNPCCKCTTPEYTIILNQQGPQGIQGKDGANGYSPTISVNTNTNDSYTLRVTNATESYITPNLKASLPSGGLAGQVLQKQTDANGDFIWGTIQKTSLPSSVLFKDEYLQYVNGSIAFLNDGSSTAASGLNVMNTTSGDGIGLGFTPKDIFLIATSNGVPLGVTGAFLNSSNTIAGDGIEIDYNNADKTITISANATQYVLPPATTTTLGGVKPDGTTITVDADGTIHGATTYTLPQATATVLGGVKAETKTDDDTQAVRIDTTTGMLYTKAGGIPSVLDGGNAASVSATAVINNISKRIDINKYPTVNTVTEEITITTPEESE